MLISYPQISRDAFENDGLLTQYRREHDAYKAGDISPSGGEMRFTSKRKKYTTVFAPSQENTTRKLV